MKTFKLLTAFIIALCLGFTSCSNDDEVEHILSNANGVIVSWTTFDVQPQQCYFWIDNYSVKFNYYESSVDKRLYSPWNNVTYRTFSMSAVYAELSNRFGMNITDGTDFSNFEPNPTKFIEYMRTQSERYQYMYFNSGETYLFNRTSQTNF